MENFLFSSWESILRTFTISVAAYGGLLIMLRIAGSRSLAQLNAFDLIVTIAMGSTLASVILNKNVALIDGLLAIGILISLQLFINVLLQKVKKLRGIFKSEPVLLFYKGEFLNEGMDKHRITRDEILQIVRSQGIASLGKVDSIVLESNGRFSVLEKSADDARSSLQNVKRPARRDDH